MEVVLGSAVPVAAGSLGASLTSRSRSSLGLFLLSLLCHVQTGSWILLRHPSEAATSMIRSGRKAAANPVLLDQIIKRAGLIPPSFCP